MTIDQRRKLFIQTYESVPILMLQGAVGERVKRNFTHRAPQPPLKLAGLYYTEDGRRGLEDAFHDYTQIAQNYRLPIMLHAYTKTAEPQVLREVGLEGRDISAENLAHCQGIVEQYPDIAPHVFIGTTLTFSGDSYVPSSGLDEEAAYRHHAVHARALEQTIVDHARTGLTPSLPEAAGCAKALSETSIPYFVSFLVRKDGKLLDGTFLHDAIGYIDDKTADNPPLFYQVNCVHPRNMRKCLDHICNRTERVRTRFKGLEGNGSDLSPEELDDSPVIYTSPAREWAEEQMSLYRDYGLKVLGGCCGTDHAHMDELARRIRAEYDRLGFDT